MYHATAEQVSGDRVFAGGKWLTCIGNKPVNVGDRIWTDGRCVYGYYMEPQQPPVILVEKEKAIPILLALGEDATGIQYKPYIFTGGELIELDDELRAKKLLAMVNNSVDRVEIFHSDVWDWSRIKQGVEAANITDFGDFFTLTVNHDKSTIAIQQNKKTLQEKSFYDFTDEVQYAEFKWSFIEDEYNWAYLVGAGTNNCLICTTNGEVKISTTAYEGETLRIPLQDENYYETTFYYCRVIETPPEGVQAGTLERILTLEDRIIYSANKRKIFEGTFVAYSYIVFKEVTEGYLLSVSPFYINPVMVWNEQYPAGALYSVNIEGNHSPIIEGGLYLIQDGKLVTLSTNLCVNLRFTPMEDYEDWFMLVEDLT